MATGTKPETPVEEANKKSKMNPPPKLLDVNSSLKDGNLSDATSCASSGDTTSTVKETDPHRGLSYYPINYYGYYYPVSFSEGDDQNYVGGNEGLETQQTAFPADNSSVPYYALGFEHGFNPYSPFMPGAYLSPDGQYLGQHGYFGGPMFSPPVLSPVAYSPDLVPGYTWDTSYIYGDGTNGSVLGDSPVYCPAKQVDSLDKAASLGRTVSPSSAQTPKAGNKVSKFSSFPQARSTFSVKENSQKTRNKLGVNEGEFLNEQNRGPRTGSQKCGSETGSEDGRAHSISQDVVVKHENYNLDEFPTKYEHALFFVIKSYSEDDVHKSIKYNVWASTPNGNQRLDNAFQIAQSKMEERGWKCPVFLFFSVNASGQFCGVAEMTGRVNFNKSMDFWQQDKWNGFFPVKWHIIKDVPNSLFRHIILENNDNKPVTNSRDTQEVKFSQGIEVLNIFKGFTAKTSILDDFGFYDNRQKAMQSRRIKVNAPQPVVNKTAADVSPLIAGLQAIQLGPAKSGGEPSKALGVKE